MIHFWTNAMGGLSYVAGFPVANCDRVLCGAGVVGDLPDVWELEDLDEDCDMQSCTPEDVTCPNCIYLLTIPGTYLLRVSERRAKLKRKK